jgi:hypothetical protein
MIKNFSTVCQLTFDKLDLSMCTEPLKNIKPNESIKRITTDDVA